MVLGLDYNDFNITGIFIMHKWQLFVNGNKQAEWKGNLQASDIPKIALYHCVSPAMDYNTAKLNGSSKWYSSGECELKCIEGKI
jgi:hypothetical protein